MGKEVDINRLALSVFDSLVLQIDRLPRFSSLFVPTGQQPLDPWQHTALVGLSGLVQTRIFGPTYRRRLHPIPLWMIATRKYENCRLGFRGAQPHIIAGSPGNAARHKCRKSEGRSLFRHAEAWGRNQNSSELLEHTSSRHRVSTCADESSEVLRTL